MALSVGFVKRNFEKLTKQKVLDLEQYVTFRVVSSNTDSVSMFKELYLSEFMPFDEWALIPVFTAQDSLLIKISNESS